MPANRALREIPNRRKLLGRLLDAVLADVIQPSLDRRSDDFWPVILADPYEAHSVRGSPATDRHLRDSLS
jgi:hypothetical protein